MSVAWHHCCLLEDGFSVNGFSVKMALVHVGSRKLGGGGEGGVLAHFVQKNYVWRLDKFSCLIF